MCGIFAYIGQENAADAVLHGLKRLEYRGYDSWGIASLAPAPQPKIVVQKTTGQIGKATLTADTSLTSGIAVGHTRWATHGGITIENAHPHVSRDGSFAVVQNGIVQNFHQLKADLIAEGYTFQSQTDTEVIVAVLERELAVSTQKTRKMSSASLRQAVRATLGQLEGRNTILVLFETGEIIAARQGSPLVIGVADHTHQEKTVEAEQIYVSSDSLSFADVVKTMIVVDNGQLVQITPHKKSYQLHIFSTEDDALLKPETQELLLENVAVEKEGFDHFMIKEIHENPEVILQVTHQPMTEYQNLASVISQAEYVFTIGSGTAGLAAAQLAYYLRHHAGILATSLVGADANEYVHHFGPGVVVIAPSQSGETADVLEVLEFAKAAGATIVSYVNMQGASMTRMADHPFLTQAGPEISVVSTKVFTAQVCWGYLVAQTVAGKYQQAVTELRRLAEAVRTYLHDSTTQSQLKKLAEYLVSQDDIFLLGKGELLQIVKEGMVKLMESSYKHAHALPAGDLKHYAITLMAEGVPAIVAVPSGRQRSDLLNAAHEVKARGATVIGLSVDFDASFDYFIELPAVEPSEIMALVPIQLLAYYVAAKLGHDVDHPRNIAKSVTVK